MRTQEKNNALCVPSFNPWGREVFFADFHVHSRFSRATSREMDAAGLARAARRKGIGLVGTGDFTHPAYLKELEGVLEPEGNGIYVHREDPDGPRFILTAEVSNIFTQGGKCRRIHTVLFAPDFRTAAEIQNWLSKVGNITSDGRPIFGFPVKDLIRVVMEISPRCLAVPAHVWTPWFSLFGAKSGFDSLEECFEEEGRHICALETGLSSDPEMNWRLSALDRYTLLSNSDAHSPGKIGREANVFSCALSYDAVMNAVRDPSQGFEGTIEFFPEEGKYHFDGHRACGVSLPPSETRRLGGRCPVCGGELTVGVLHRVEDLADRPEGFRPPHALPAVHLVPLDEIIAEAVGVKSRTSRVRKEYGRLVGIAGSEMEILLRMEEKELSRFVPDRILAGIRRVREGSVHVIPGSDGTYGRVMLFADGDDSRESPLSLSAHQGQLNLFD